MSSTPTPRPAPARARRVLAALTLLAALAAAPAGADEALWEALRAGGFVIMIRHAVTHNFNIRAVAGVSPATAELVGLRPARDGRLERVGRIPAPR